MKIEKEYKFLNICEEYLIVLFLVLLKETTVSVSKDLKLKPEILVYFSTDLKMRILHF